MVKAEEIKRAVSDKLEKEVENAFEAFKAVLDKKSQDALDAYKLSFRVKVSEVEFTLTDDAQYTKLYEKIEDYVHSNGFSYFPFWTNGEITRIICSVD